MSLEKRDWVDMAMGVLMQEIPYLKSRAAEELATSLWFDYQGHDPEKVAFAEVARVITSE